MQPIELVTRTQRCGTTCTGEGMPWFRTHDQHENFQSSKLPQAAGQAQVEKGWLCAWGPRFGVLQSFPPKRVWSNATTPKSSNGEARKWALTVDT